MYFFLLFCAMAYYILFYILYMYMICNSGRKYEDALAFEMNNPILIRYCSVHDIITTQTVIILLAVPLHEFVICPLFENYIPTSLKKIGIGALVSIAAISSALIIDLYIHEGPDHTPKDHCIKSESNTTYMNSSTSAALIAVPITVDYIAELIVYISSTFL